MKELIIQLNEAKKKLVDLQVEQVKGTLKDPSQLRKAKKEIARLFTKINMQKNES